jgi:hypothetical protein
MPFQTYNIPNHTSGDTFNGVEFEVLVNTLPLDLTGANIIMKLRQNNNINAYYELNVANGNITITFPLLGKFTIDQQIINFAPAKYNYSIELHLANGNTYTYIQGSWTIIAQAINNG